MYFDKVVAVARLQPTAGDTDKEQYQAVGNYQGVKMNIQPASAELTAVSDGKYGRTYRAFTAVSGILIGDRVTVSGSNEAFVVQGVDNWYNGILPHLEITLFKGDP